MSIILNEDQKENLKNIDAPTLLIWGECDTATPISDAKLMEKLIPDAGLVSYPNSGHYSYIENLPACNLVIKEFLKQEAKEKGNHHVRNSIKQLIIDFICYLFLR